jgi:hypothetical protein
MESREIAHRVIHFEDPPRIAATFPAPYWNDFAWGIRRPPIRPENEWHEVGGGRWERVDMYGSVWGRVDPISNGEVIRGALKSLDDADTFELPDLTVLSHYEPLIQYWEENPDKYRVGWLGGFTFSITRYFFTLQDYLMNLALEPERMGALMDRVDDMIEAMILRFAELGADGVMIFEDWGTQQRLMISPAMWREQFKPRFRRLCGTIHDAGMTMFMHSCGKMTAIIPDLIEVGVDVFQFDQPRLHGFDVLNQYAGQVTYWCPVDIQTTLQTGDIDQVEADVCAMIEKLGTAHGGFIGGYYPQPEAINVDPEFQRAASRLFMKHGVYDTAAVEA